MTAVIIAGCMRNGTSICSNVLANTGMWVGKKKELDWRGKRDPEGIWENLNFVTLNNALIESRRGDWVNFIHVWRAVYYDWPELLTAQDFQKDYNVQALELISRMSHEHELWGWKDPRNALTAPYWIEMLQRSGETDIRLIWAFRDPAESIDSMFSLGYARQRNWHGFWDVWHAYNQALLNLWNSPEYEFLSQVGVLKKTMVKYSDWFANTEATVSRMQEFVGIKPTSANIADGVARVKPELYRYQSDKEIYSTLYKEMLRLYDAI